jgi:hypothetical protein
MSKKPHRPVELAISVKWNVDLRTPDEWLADELLWGHGEASTNGLLRRKYLLPGSEKEHMARQALVRLLHGDQHLSTTLRKRLAELFDVESTLTERQLVIQFRRRGHRSQHMANSQVANFVDRKIREGYPVEAAVQLAMDAYRLTRKAIFDMRRKHKRAQKVTSNRTKR